MTLPCVCTTVRKANRALFRFYEDALAEADLTIVQFAILRALQRNGDTPLPQIAEELVLERTSLYRTIAPLVDAGAIRLSDAKRGRSKIAKLTRRGERQIEQARPYWERAQASVVSKLGKTQWALLSEAMLGIPELLQSIDPAND